MSACIATADALCWTRSLATGIANASPPVVSLLAHRRCGAGGMCRRWKPCCTSTASRARSCRTAGNKAKIRSNLNNLVYLGKRQEKAHRGSTRAAAARAGASGGW